MVGVDGGQLGRGWHKTQLDYTLEALFAHHVPPGIENAVIALDELGRHLHRNVHGLKREEAEKGLTSLAPIDVLDHLIDEIAGGVKIFRQPRWLAVLIPRHLGITGQVVGVVVVAPAGGIHHVRAIEAKPIWKVFTFRTDAPFPGDVRSISCLRQDRRNRRLILIPGHGIAWIRAHFGRNGFHQSAHPDLMIVHPGHQHGAAWAAKRRRIIA